MEQQNENPETNGITNGPLENEINGHLEPPETLEQASQKIEPPMDEKAKSPEGSEGSGEGIQLSNIKIITKYHEESEEESGDDDEEEEPEEEIKPKKMVKKKKKKKVVKPAEVLTKTLAQAIRLINETKEKERQKARKEEIRKMALAQKERQESAGQPRVRIHV